MTTTDRTGADTATFDGTKSPCPVCGRATGGEHGTPSMAHDCEFPGCVFGPLHSVGYHLMRNGQRVPA